MSLTSQEWERVTIAAHSKVAGFFKPKENLIILDFIHTAMEDIPTVVAEIAEQEKAT